MVIRLANRDKAFYIADPEVSWEIEFSTLKVNLAWDVLPEELGDLPQLFPGAVVGFSFVKPEGAGWVPVVHVLNGDYVIEEVTVSRTTKVLTYNTRLRRRL